MILFMDDYSKRNEIMNACANARKDSLMQVWLLQKWIKGTASEAMHAEVANDGFRLDGWMRMEV